MIFERTILCCFLRYDYITIRVFGLLRWTLPQCKESKEDEI